MDLKWLLVRRITLALACFLAGAGLALYISARDAKRQNVELAKLAARQLELQLSRIDRSTEIRQRFPDWSIVSNYVLQPGQCVEFRANAGGRNRSSCAGFGESVTAPRWFFDAYRLLINSRLEASAPLTYRGADQGIIVASFNYPARLYGAQWKHQRGSL